MKHWVRRVLLKNLVLKILSVALAVLLFAVVHSEKSSMAQGDVAVSYSLPAGKLLLNKPPAVLRIGVIGPTFRLQRFRFEDVAAVTVNLNDVREGELKFRDEGVVLPAGLKVAFIRPESFLVRYEPILRRRLPVHLVLRGEAAAGFRILVQAVRPARVTISGARSVVKSLSAVPTEPLIMDEPTASFTQKVALAPLPQGAKMDEDPRLEAIVTIGPVSAKRRESSTPGEE